MKLAANKLLHAFDKLSQIGLYTRVPYLIITNLAFNYKEKKYRNFYFMLFFLLKFSHQSPAD